MPATNIERLIVNLEARTVAYERALNKAMGVTNQRLGQMERRASRAGANISGALGRVFAIGVSGAALRGAQQLIDASIRVENSLKVAGLAGEELNQVYDRLFASAQRNAAPLESLVELYSRASLVQKELGVSTEELLGFTDHVAVALRVSGKSASEASGALLQLSQALGSGVVRAEEFNSILEGALPIAQAAAAGLEEAGGSVAKLRSLVVDGKVSSEAFFRAFEAGSVILEEKVAGAELTVSQQFVRLTNVLIKTAGQFDSATGTSEALGKALGVLADAIENVGNFFEENEPAIRTFTGVLADMLGYATALADVLPKAVARGADQPNVPGFDEFISNHSISSPTPRGPSGRGGRRGAPPVAAAAQTVSLADFALPAAAANSNAAAATQKHAEAVEDLISDLLFEGDLIGKTALQQEQMNAVRRAGAAATDEQRAQIEELVAANFDEQARVQALSDLYDELGDIGRNAIMGIVDAMKDGKVEGNELLGIVSDLLAQAGSFFLNQAFGGGSGGNIFGTLFGGARASGGPVDAGKAYLVGERGRELFVPKMSGTIVSNGALSGGGMSLVINNTINAPGATRDAAPAIAAQVTTALKQQLPDAIRQYNKNPLRRAG